MHGPSRWLVVLGVCPLLVSHASAQCSYTADYTICYAPPDVATSGGVPHPIHELTIFLPDGPPPLDGDGLYPVLLYSPAGAFQQGSAAEQLQSTEGLFGEREPLQTITGSSFYIDIDPGAPGSTGDSTLGPPCGLLDEALERGWAVVTVGSTGWNSWPTCAQDDDCTECQNTSAEPCGRCCLPDDTCVDGVTEDDCFDVLGGVDWLSGATCADDPCPAPTGRCCLPMDVCMDGVTEGECNGLGGTMWLEGGDCTNDPCPTAAPVPPATDAFGAPREGTPMCRDTNLWVDPASPEWDDFNVFSGEKEFTWARQWIAEHGANPLYNLDTDRVVACGTSTGSIYSAFLAFGPNRAWGSGFSSQAQRDTRIAAMVAFEPNTWIRALSPVQPAVHWASSTDPLDICDDMTPFCNAAPAAECYNRRGTTIDSVLLGAAASGLVESSSVSRWIRDIEGDELPTPCFIAAGDGLFTTGFARDANLPPGLGDYDRHVLDFGCGSTVGANPALIPGDPALEFTMFPGELKLHDSWYAVNFMLDLVALDAFSADTTHTRLSRLYLQEGHDWTKLPPCLSTTASKPTTKEEVALLDGTFADESIKQSINNNNLAPKVVTWMEAVLCVQRGLGLVSRNPLLVGPCDGNGNPTVMNENPDIYTSATSYDGLTIKVEVDMNDPSVADYEEAAILVFSDVLDTGMSPSLTQCQSFQLSAGQTLLCNIALFQSAFGTAFKAPDGDGIVRFELGPASGVGTVFATQAILRDTVVPPMSTKVPFALTNAVDITVQYMP